MTNARRIALVAFFVVVAVVVLVVIRPRDTSKQLASALTAVRAGGPEVGRGTLVRVVGGRPVGGVARISASKGQLVRFTVIRMWPMRSTSMATTCTAMSRPAGRCHPPATIDSVFVVELEHHGEQIAELRVSP